MTITFLRLIGRICCFLALLLFTIPIAQAQIDSTVTGIVTDAGSKIPLSGVQVKSRITKASVVTDESGKYEIRVPANDVVTFSFAEHADEEEPVNGRLSISVKLLADVDYKGLPEWKWHKTGHTEYYLYTPRNMKPGEKYPIALFLHGCCGVNEHASLRNLVDAPVRMWHGFGADTQKTPTYIVVPATSRGWAQHITDVKNVLDSLTEKQNGNAKKIYICGFSMGAEGTFTFINRYPDYFAAAMTMGMRFHGDSLKVKNLPLWVNQGETDYFSRPLRRQVIDMRRLNGYETDTGATSVTGVNPRYTNFKGLGHVVLWESASRQNMVEWAYAHENDGNIAPNIYFLTPAYGSTVSAGKPIHLDISASDADGTVEKVFVYNNHKLIRTLTKSPWQCTVIPQRGENSLEAVATDNGGKMQSALIVIKTQTPLSLVTRHLPDATAGKMYRIELKGVGYGTLHFRPNRLPSGLELTPWGEIKGIPVVSGAASVKFELLDSCSKKFYSLNLRVMKKKTGSVLVTEAKNDDNFNYKISVIKNGETPNFNSKDTVASPYSQEISFSNVNKYEGLTFIKTDVLDANKSKEVVLSFVADENVTLYIAYEKVESRWASTIPSWLKGFQKKRGQIIAQYRYFDVYAKKFPKGIIKLPGANAKENGVRSNYFVMIKRD